MKHKQSKPLSGGAAASGTDEFDYFPYYSQINRLMDESGLFTPFELGHLLDINNQKDSIYRIQHTIDGKFNYSVDKRYHFGILLQRINEIIVGMQDAERNFHSGVMPMEGVEEDKRLGGEETRLQQLVEQMDKLSLEQRRIW